MEKRVIIATVLSTLVIIGWTMFFVNKPKPYTVPRQLETTSKSAEIVQKNAPAVEMNQIDSAKDKDIIIECASNKVVFNTLGARIKSWYVKEKNSKQIDLVLTAPDNGFEAENFATFNKINFKIDSKSETGIVFSAVVDNVKVVKTYELSQGCLNKVSFQITNQSNKPRSFPLNMSWGPGIGAAPAEQKQEDALTRVIALAQISAKASTIQKLKADTHDATPYKWVGIDNRYFLIALINEKNLSSIVVNQDKTSLGKLFTMKAINKLELLPGKTEKLEYSFYIGPKVHSELKKLGLGLEESIDFGFFSMLGKGAFFSLKYMYGIVKNYGIAIIILTLIMQVVLFPLTMKSYQATNGLKLLQPKMKELQTKFKDEPKRLNAEMMNLYKSHKVNPLGGCLPMLLQIPIFLALYNTLSNTYELRQAPFFLWINDLSAPDLLFSVSGLPIRVLPLLMGAGMFIQQKASGASTDPSQKMMVIMMPIIFTFIFYNFASGLVLYWFVNSLFTLLGQYVVMKPKKS
ncbi:MAG: hypothetical protein A2252_01000 [Elusimicrobia bacterium RIFOXYA2_FULL_39_19]|nr:MAG: hypothetical protein A2252_01000 [Elusimicrobia bacterium RIFOXYA2_FULL_39_19]